MKKYLLDTNILMSTENYEKMFKDFEDCALIIHPAVIEELDNIKTREGASGYQARRAIKALRKYADKFIFIASDLDTNKVDNLLLEFSYRNDFTVLTNDANVQLKGEHILDLHVEQYNQQKKTISSGYTLIQEGEEFPKTHCGMYLIEYTAEDYNIHKSYGDGLYTEVIPQNIGNYMTGVVSPRDEFQVCAIDSLVNDDFTIITGAAGSGKTLLSLTYALREIQSGNRGKLIIFTNPVKTRGAEELGYYPGDRTEKLMSNSVGAILKSKLGGVEPIYQLMSENRLEILPLSDIRGFEVGPDDIMYITEAQNLNVDLIKLAIQRCAEGSKIILEGDPTTQVDHWSFEGDGNGLVRAIEVFEGYEGFSHINLPTIYRSKIADRAERM